MLELVGNTKHIQKYITCDINAVVSTHHNLSEFN